MLFHFFNQLTSEVSTGKQIIWLAGGGMGHRCIISIGRKKEAVGTIFLQQSLSSKLLMIDKKKKKKKNDATDESK